MLGILAIPVNCKGQILPREGEFFQNFLIYIWNGHALGLNLPPPPLYVTVLSYIYITVQLPLPLRYICMSTEDCLISAYQFRCCLGLTWVCLKADGLAWPEACTVGSYRYHMLPCTMMTIPTNMCNKIQFCSYGICLIIISIGTWRMRETAGTAQNHATHKFSYTCMTQVTSRLIYYLGGGDAYCQQILVCAFWTGLLPLII